MPETTEYLVAPKERERHVLADDLRHCGVDVLETVGRLHLLVEATEEQRRWLELLVGEHRVEQDRQDVTTGEVNPMHDGVPPTCPDCGETLRFEHCLNCVDLEQMAAEADSE